MSAKKKKKKNKKKKKKGISNTVCLPGHEMVINVFPLFSLLASAVELKNFLSISRRKTKPLLYSPIHDPKVFNVLLLDANGLRCQHRLSACVEAHSVVAC